MAYSICPQPDCCKKPNGWLENVYIKRQLRNGYTGVINDTLITKFEDIPVGYTIYDVQFTK